MLCSFVFILSLCLSQAYTSALILHPFAGKYTLTISGHTLIQCNFMQCLCECDFPLLFRLILAIFYLGIISRRYCCCCCHGYRSVLWLFISMLFVHFYIRAKPSLERTSEFHRNKMSHSHSSHIIYCIQIIIPAHRRWRERQRERGRTRLNENNSYDYRIQPHNRTYGTRTCDMSVYINWYSATFVLFDDGTHHSSENSTSS